MVAWSCRGSYSGGNIHHWRMLVWTRYSLRVRQVSWCMVVWSGYSLRYCEVGGQVEMYLTGGWLSGSGYRLRDCEANSDWSSNTE
jgi:hypothetical protein